MESVTGGQEGLGALLAGWVAAAGRGLFFPARLSDPAALQEGIGHNRHQKRGGGARPRTGPRSGPGRVLP